MAESSAPLSQTSRRPIRWWPGIFVFAATVAAIGWVRAQSEWPFQERNLTTAKMGLIAIALLALWWTFFSRTPARLRMGVTFGLIGLVAVSAALFRFHGVSGDLAPILEFRWAKNTPPGALPATALTDSAPTVQRFNASTSSDFPQYLGSKGNGVLAGPRLDANWEANPPAVVWRKEVGPAWSGFAIVGEICVTPEQRGEDECVVAYELATGKQIWLHADKAHYHTTIAGEGPRATPTILNNRVFACGSTGILNCMDLATGRLFWTRNVVAESGGFLSGALPVHRWWWVAW